MQIRVGQLGRTQEIHQVHKQEISALFSETFTAAESAEEGKLIGRFVDDLMANTADNDLFVFTAYDQKSLDEESLVGSVVFSRLTYHQDDRAVFILSPAAVKTARQKTGVGQTMITSALDTLRVNGVDVALTYGDPNYYGRFGFHPITEEIAQAPLPLSHPHGWLGQSLKDEVLRPLLGPCACVEALNNPALW